MAQRLAMLLVALCISDSASRVIRIQIQWVIIPIRATRTANRAIVPIAPQGIENAYTEVLCRKVG
jgi:hypothetical protein